ncbi:plasma membrane-associated coenzyme Q6 reductase Pga3p [[Candida] jaroonii]|uniref:Plasma membrane-associated coenzyme Q6 reductase Pga3p n=1 Tax=[Candida] jaroonii TaxID=467808 RepID=A0ACA9YB60_9ASCO|nr:plasma membrane-associated coenzyme Q6 reductase Pga3p [[Candida] jaroonii]
MVEIKDNRDLLKTKLHGIFIPVALLLIGPGIMGLQYIKYGAMLAIVLCSINFYEAWQRGKTIDSVKWRDLELIDKTIVSKNTAIYRFKLIHDDEILDIPTGHHLACTFNIDGKDEIRYYSPISNKYDAGFFDILVKSYPNGKVSKRFAMMKEGEGQTVKFRGPVGRLQYETNMANEIGLIAGGSGITPILQVITRIITTPEDNTKLSLIFANDTENDILLKEEIDQITEKYPNLSVHYTLVDPPANWKGEVGYVSKEMIQKYLPKPIGDNRLFICGPPEMKRSLIDITQELGWPATTMKSDPQDKVFCF